MKEEPERAITSLKIIYACMNTRVGKLEVRKTNIKFTTELTEKTRKCSKINKILPYDSSIPVFYKPNKVIKMFEKKKYIIDLICTKNCNC